MKEKASFKYLLFALLIGFGGFAAAFAPVLLIPMAALVAFIALYWGGGCAALVLTITGAGVIVANMSDGIIPTVSMFVLVVGASVFLTVGLRKKIAYRYIVLGLAVLTFACLYCYIGLGSIIAGKEPYAPLTERFSLLASLYKASGVSGADEIASNIHDIIDQIPIVFYGILILVSEAIAFFSLILAKIWCRSKKAELAPMAKFIEWQLPPSLRFGLPVLIVGIIVLFVAKVNAAYAVLYTVVYMLLPLFEATGFGCLLFIATRRGKGFLRVFAILMLVFAPFFVALIGVFDLYYGLRRRMMKIDRLIREAFEKAEKENRNTVTVDLGDGRGPQVIAVRKERTEDAFFDNIPEPVAPQMEGETEGSQKTDEYPADASNETAEHGASSPETEQSTETQENYGNTDYSDHENGGGEA